MLKPIGLSGEAIHFVSPFWQLHRHTRHTTTIPPASFLKPEGFILLLLHKLLIKLRIVIIKVLLVQSRFDFLQCLAKPLEMHDLTGTEEF